MHTRREILVSMGAGLAAAAASPLLAQAATPREPKSAADDAPEGKRYQPPDFGLGGVAIGTAFAPLSAEQAEEVMEAAWAAGVRYFDTAPWYGLGLSERRMGHFLAEQEREQYVLSTKVGRVLTPTQQTPKVMWKRPSPFNFTYDFTADGTRRSIDDSLQRMGTSRIDVVFIHDLSPDHFGEKWTEQFEIAEKGAIPALTRLRDEGVIKAWGFGVNDVEPCLRALEVADPDVFLLATQYSIVHHADSAIKELFPKCEERDVSIVVGAPFNSGFLAGRDRYNYRDRVPAAIREKGERISAIAKEHGTDLRTAALQFCAAPNVVSSVIPGASSAEQVIENAISMRTSIPPEFWSQLKREKLIAENAPTPA